MKVEIHNDNIIVIIKDNNISQVDFNDMVSVEKYFRKILLKLKDLYEIDIKGFYNIYAYIDLEEGIVLEIKKEVIDYYDTFHQLELRIVKENVEFLYEVDNILEFMNKKFEVYCYNDRFFIRNNYDDISYRLYEFGNLVYKDTKKIKENGKKMTIL